MTSHTHTPENNHLKHVLNFGDSDLAMNRRGQISETQRTRLKKEQRSSAQSMWTCGLLCGMLVVFLLLLLANFSNQFVTRYVNPVLFGVLVAGLLFVLMSGRVQRGTSADLALNRVESTAGQVRKHTEKRDDGIHYYITVKDKSYGVPQPVYEAFKEDVCYRFYHTASAFTLMSVEVIDAEDADLPSMAS
jgi:hypothetical protein